MNIVVVKTKLMETDKTFNAGVHVARHGGDSTSSRSSCRDIKYFTQHIE